MPTWFLFILAAILKRSVTAAYYTKPTKQVFHKLPICILLKKKFMGGNGANGPGSAQVGIYVNNKLHSENVR